MTLARAAFALLLLATPAAAQTDFATPQPGRVAQGVVQMCLNVAGQAVPVSSGSCAATGPSSTASIGSSNIATGTGSAGTVATLLVPARAGRYAVTIENTSTTAFFIGAANVSPSNGFPIPGSAGSSVTVPTGAAIYGVTASGSAPIAYIETY